jgi:hypothetical protein
MPAMPSPLEPCENCGRAIDMLEQANLFEEHVVCAQCIESLRNLKSQNTAPPPIPSPAPPPPPAATAPAAHGPGSVCATAEDVEAIGFTAASAGYKPGKEKDTGYEPHKAYREMWRENPIALSIAIIIAISIVVLPVSCVVWILSPKNAPAQTDTNTDKTQIRNQILQ